MNVNRGGLSWALMLLAFVFFVILALIEGGAVTWSMPWLLGGGLASVVLSFLTERYGNWNNGPVS